AGTCTGAAETTPQGSGPRAREASKRCPPQKRKGQLLGLHRGRQVDVTGGKTMKGTLLPLAVSLARTPAVAQPSGEISPLQGTQEPLPAARERQSGGDHRAAHAILTHA